MMFVSCLAQAIKWPVHLCFYTNLTKLWMHSKTFAMKLDPPHYEIFFYARPWKIFWLQTIFDYKLKKHFWLQSRKIVLIINSKNICSDLPVPGAADHRVHGLEVWRGTPVPASLTLSKLRYWGADWDEPGKWSSTSSNNLDPTHSWWLETSRDKSTKSTLDHRSEL